MKKLFASLIFGLLLTMLVPFTMMDAYALAAPGDMYAGTGRNGPTDGAVFIVSITGPLIETLVGDPTPGTDGLSSIAIDSTGKLFATTLPQGGTGPSNLLQINPTTGAVIQDFGTIATAGGTTIRINDLTVQPGTDIIFGISSAFGGSGGAGQLYTVSQTIPPIATPVGPNNGMTLDELPIGFAPDGTLYMICLNCASIGGGSNQLLTVNPTTGVILTQVSINPVFSFSGLGVRADGTIFAAQRAFDGNGVHTISVTGTSALVGNYVESYGDLAFFPDTIVGGEIIPIASTTLILAGLQSSAIWMLPALAGIAGAGFYLIKFRTNKE